MSFVDDWKASKAEGTENVEPSKDVEVKETPAPTEEKEASTPEPTQEQAEQTTEDIDSLELPDDPDPVEKEKPVRKEWADMSPDEKKDFIEIQKKEYDRYNTQNSQKNAALRKQLQEEQELFNRQRQEFERQRQEILAQQQQQNNVGGEGLSEVELLAQATGIPLDEFSSDTEIAMAKKVLEQNRVLESERKRQEESYRQADIQKRLATWEAIKADPKENIPQTDEFEEAVFSLVLAKKATNYRYDVRDAVNDMKNVLGLDTKESFIDFTTKSQFYNDVKAHVISELRAEQSRRATLPPQSNGQPSSTPTRETPTASLDTAMQRYFASRR